MIITEKVVKHPDRAEADRFFNFPYAAVEEALSNAVYHRAYDEREPIEVRVENDRIEIVSFLGPDRSVTIEGLKSYRVSNRRYRNRRIGDFLKNAFNRRKKHGIQEDFGCVRSKWLSKAGIRDGRG